MTQFLPTEGQALAEMVAVLAELDSCLANHVDWFKHIQRVLVCDMAVDVQDLREDAHRLCPVGLWYYRPENHPLLAAMPAFQTLGAIHCRLHQLARQLLQQKSAALPIAVDVYDAFMEDAFQLKQVIRQLQREFVQHEGMVDALTGVWSRHGMMPRLAEEQERMIRSGEACSVCLFDVDQYPAVVEIYGPAAGDELLKGAVQQIGSVLRKYDSMFRYSQHEFLICMPRTPVEQAQHILERVRGQLWDKVLPIGAGMSSQTGASFGLAPMLPMDIGDVLDAAQHALRCAQERGGDQVCLWGR